MKNRHVAALLVSGAFAMAASLALIAQSAAALAPAAPAAPARPAGAPPPGTAPLEILEFKPAFDDLMTMIVQPRHTKLWIAAQQKNWQLAGFQLNELGAALRRIGATIPKYRNISVDATIASIFAPKIAAVAGAIGGQNAAQFNIAYTELTSACNLCHEALDHAFLVIKVPDANAAASFPDQDFRPLPAAAPGR